MMTGEATIFFVFAIILLFLIPYFIRRDFKRGKSFTDQFTTNGMLILLFFVSIGEVLKSVWSESMMEGFNQILFIGFIVIGALPAMFLFVYHFPKDMKNWGDPDQYKNPAAYRFRHVLLLIMFAFLGGALFMLYQSYKAVF
jgi:hypothetical protein